MNEERNLKYIVKKTIIIGTMFILITTSIIPIHASKNIKDISTQPALENSENILGYITVEWESFWTHLKLLDLIPKVNITQSDMREFNFTEINGVIQMNFTVLCKQICLNQVLFPRFTRFDVIIKHDGLNIYNYNTSFHLWKNLTWEYITITLGPNDSINPLETNGHNATLEPTLGIRAFPGALLGNYKTIDNGLEPITVIPIPSKT